jgi:virginiamycin B lyase
MRRRDLFALAGAALAAPALSPRPAAGAAAPAPPGYRVTWFDATTPGSGRVGARDVTAAGDGTFWFCGQANGTLNRLDPRDGAIRVVPLGKGAAPHGVVRGPDGAAWVTEGGQDAIARVDPADHRVRLWHLPERFADANLNTACSMRGAFTGSLARTASTAAST